MKGSLAQERFLESLSLEIEKLRNQGQLEGINPKGRNGLTMIGTYVISYAYSLHSLESGLHCLSSFVDDLSERKNGDINNSLFKLDRERCESLPSEVAFYLRGYVRALDEDNVLNELLDDDKLDELQILLKEWHSVNMRDGAEKKKLYEFLLEDARIVIGLHAANKSNTSKQEKDNEAKRLVDTEIKAFKEVLLISSGIVNDIFDDAWGGYDVNGLQLVGVEIEREGLKDSLTYKRLFETINHKAKELKEKEGSEINPTGIVTGDEDYQYVYSLVSLDFVLSRLNSFCDDLDKRKRNNKNSSLFESDKKLCKSLPPQIAFNLRGYIGVVSEDSMILDGEKLDRMLRLLQEWFDVNMTDGARQSYLYGFLWELEDEQIKNIHGLTCEQMRCEEFVVSQVEKKLKLLKEILLVSRAIVNDMFHNAWGVYPGK